MEASKSAMTSVHRFQVVSYNKDGWLLLGSSALTGNIWDGRLSIFSGYDDFVQCPNLTMVASNTPSGVNDALWLPGNQAVLAGCDSGCLEVYRVQRIVLCETETKIQAHDDIILGVASLADGENVISVGQDSKVVVSNIEQEKVVNTYRGHSDAVLAVASHPTSDSVFMTTSRDGNVWLWDTRKSLPANRLKNLNGTCIMSVAWSTHNQNIIATGGQNGSVRVMDLRKESEDSSCVWKYQPHNRDVTKLAFAPWNCNVLASVSEDTLVKVHSIKNESTIYSSSQHTDYVLGVSWHPHKPYILTCGWDGQLLLHNAGTEEQNTEISVEMETSKEHDVDNVEHEQ